MKIKSLVIVVVLLVSVTSKAYSQWECRSHLSANLKPISENFGLNWAVEVVGSGGYITNSQIYSGMAFAALDYTFNNHQIYAEGGYKYWLQNDMTNDYQYSNNLFGLRELSYNYYSPKVELNVGLHQMGLKDHFLVNERAWGAGLASSVKGFDLELDVATVTKDFSRNGTFCSNCYLYDIVPTRNYPAGNVFGETNFAAFSFSRNVASKADKTKSDDEFESFESTDEFESFDTGDEFGSFSEVEENKEAAVKMKSWGGVVYSEFGSYYYQPSIFGGLFTTIQLGENLTLKAEGLYQYVVNNQAMIGYLQVAHNSYWNADNTTTLQANFLGKIGIDENAFAMPRFSNLFFGEVFRMDAVDLPLLNVSVKHKFSKHQLSVKGQYNHQFTGNHMQEFNLSVGKFLFDKHLRTTLLAGMMKSDDLNAWSNLARLEVRVFF